MMTALLLLAWPPRAFCSGDEGHEIIGSIAEYYLSPAVRLRVAALLAGDATGLARSRRIADEATWADKFRDSDRNGSQLRYRQTREWHYVDIELDRPDIDAACHGHPAVPSGGRASTGAAADCIIDKIEQFRRELRSVTTTLDERRLALQFLLHFVGDVHQPLHAADDHDHGGNDVSVKTAGGPTGNLHHYWDTVFVAGLGTRADEVAHRLLAGITEERRRAWSSGAPAAWARQSFHIAKLHVYGKLPHANTRGGKDDITLDERYVADAESIVRVQLQRAGLRLARLLNEALR